MSAELNILIVDDDPIDRMQLKRALKKSDVLCNIQVAESADECLNTREKHFDLYFFDYLLGTSTGIELVELIRSKGIKEPIIVITSQSDPELSKKALLAGANNYLTKNLISPEGVALIVNNTISLHKIGLELEEARNEAVRLANIKQQFLSNVSHEIRTPMHAINGFSKKLMDITEGKAAEYAKLIYGSAQGLITLLNDILDTSKIEAGKLHIEKISFSIRDLLLQVIHVMESQVKSKKVKLFLSIDDAIDTFILADPHRIRQILFNLISNAIKFTEEGTIEVHVDLVSKSEKLFLKFLVKDSGIGIASDKQDLIFESFSQAEASTTRIYGGTGLGLSICKALVLLMDGEIGVHSKLGQGSEFFFLLPYVLGENEKLKSSAFTEVKIHSFLDVLLVDDDPVNRLLATDMMQEFNWKITEAEDGKMAFEKACNHNYDLIVMDIQMPLMDGIEATGLIREEGIQTPIIGLSAHSADLEKKRCFSAGMNHYVQKPFEKNDLLRAVNEAMELSLDEVNNDQHSSKWNIKKLMNEVSPDLEDQKEVLTSFYHLIEEYIQNMDKNMQTADLQSIALENHKISASLAMLGFETLSENCSTLEKLADNSENLKSLSKIYDSLRDDIQEIKMQVEKWISNESR